MQLTTQVRAQLVERFGAAGWDALPSVEFDVISFNKQEFPEVIFSFAANLAVDGYRFSNDPGLGVVHKETSVLNGRFLERKSSRADTAIVGTDLQTLMPATGYELASITRWGALDQSGIDDACAALFDDVTAYGMAFLRKFPTLDACIDHALSVKRWPALNQHLAIALALQGRMSEALPILAEYAAKAAGQRPPLSTQTETFVRNFLDYFDVPSGSITLTSQQP